ncbi:MAG: hypothetical protein QGG24_08420 [Vicinamibacterales bacterium]|jgi:hypothetical protein|nr:hypothetical protein [Acidobacteriota bacterium]MDP7295332.1 hypothetical protein [Vicinamibacterales bacterium]MDP7472619.1 hypothetical protein [Vicinamibacterales bacterium]MDP7670349.1 hypothetical protein [Vicinamibacterales bacterium]HJO38006.1 hypothetical protein [Vicinamibacterales bacterium]|tara:strand:- start:86 stop:289 length:204 start_codon:yes stop_codon:yes gene_type:complete
MISTLRLLCLTLAVLLPADSVVAQVDAIWHIKVVTRDGQFLDVKALDASGGIHDVKAIQDATTTSFV